MKPIQLDLTRRGALRAIGVAGGALALPALAQSPTVTLRYASLFNKEHSASRSSEYFAELVAKKTDGKVRIQVFHNGALGTEEEAARGVHSGTIDLGYSGLPGFGSFIRDIRVLEMPYLYASLDELKQVVDRVRPTLAALFLKAGFQPLGYQFDGPRMTLATRPLRSFADFKGLKFRVPQSPLYVNMLKAFGAIPTPVALPEAYTALQAHVADAIEGSATTLFTGKYYEVARNLIRTDHIFYVAYVAMNPGVFQRQEPEIQKALLEAGDETTGYNLTIAKQANRGDLDRLVKAGVAMMTPPRPPFVDAVRPMNQAYAESLGGQAMDIYGEVRQVTGH
ncbi:MAG TPA: TRAP transporter substrate-binding protein [Acetobacteraceae bacterium]|jgi:tripartite ATP-independent transporter DctP family solute receptor|nr:TRAP transporter substrate-binding protein [Acetobacteraceae bacterium]